jgi:pimeloyl-ACP methyl ester carboxylesterase
VTAAAGAEAEAPDLRGAARLRVRVRGGLSVAVLTWGVMSARTPLLCLPGLVRTGGDFAHLAERHAARRLVVSLDYPGRGDSDRALLWRRYLPERILKDVIDVCSALSLRRVVAVGTSLGAILAMGLATVRPRLVAAALLNDAGPVLDPRGLGFVRGFVGHDHPQPSLEAAIAFLRRTLPWLSLRTDREWREMALLTFRRGADGTWRANWDTRIARVLDRPMTGDLWDLFAPLARIPALLVRGGESDVLSAETAAEMRRRFPCLRYAELPGVGHAPTLSEPGLAGTVDDFLEAQP